MASTKKLQKKVRTLSERAASVEARKDWNKRDGERYRVRAGKLARSLYEARMALEAAGGVAVTAPQRRPRAEVVTFD